MEEINERLADHEIIGLDTAVFLYQLQADEDLLPVTNAILKGIRAGRWQGVISGVTLMELTTLPWRINRRDAAYDYENLLAGFPNLTMADITRTVARQAAQLRAIYNIAPLNALSLAAALAHEATAWITYDPSLKRIEPMMDVVLLEECVAYEF